MASTEPSFFYYEPFLTAWVGSILACLLQSDCLNWSNKIRYRRRKLNPISKVICRFLLNLSLPVSHAQKARFLRYCLLSLPPSTGGVKSGCSQLLPERGQTHVKHRSSHSRSFPSHPIPNPILSSFFSIRGQTLHRWYQRGTNQLVTCQVKAFLSCFRFHLLLPHSFRYSATLCLSSLCYPYHNGGIK